MKQLRHLLRFKGLLECEAIYRLAGVAMREMLNQAEVDVCLPAWTN